MDYVEYKKLRDSIDAEYQKKKEALEMVWHMSQNQGANPDMPEGKISGKVSDVIRKVIDGLPGEFSANDVGQGLKDHGYESVKRILLTNTLHRLQRHGEIIVVKKGIGRSCGIYRKMQKMETAQ